MDGGSQNLRSGRSHQALKTGIDREDLKGIKVELGVSVQKLTERGAKWGNLLEVYYHEMRRKVRRRASHLTICII